MDKKTRLFSCLDNMDNMDNKEEPESKKQRVNNASVYFKFCDSSTIINQLKYWNEKLKSKISSPIELQCIFTHDEKTLKQWKIVRDKVTGKTIDLKELVNHKYEKIGAVLVDGRTKSLLVLCQTQIEIRNFDSFDLEKKLKFETWDSSPSCMTWWINGNKKFLIIGLNSGKIEIRDWKTLEIFKTLDFENSIVDLKVDQKLQQLIIYDNWVITLWCLKTFTQLKHFDHEQKELECQFLNDGLFATCNCYLPNNGGGINLWKNKVRVSQTTAHKQIASCILHSSKLQLLLSCGDEYVCAWKVVVSLEAEYKLEKVFSIESPFFENDEDTERLQFLDSENQTELLVGTTHGDFFIINLISKQVTWKREAAHDNIILNMVLPNYQ